MNEQDKALTTPERKMRVLKFIPIIALLLISCSNPNYRLFTNDGKYHDCNQVQETKTGWYCDQEFYPFEKVSYVVTSLHPA